ncbi:MAG: SHOCT domain-containing protein [Lachnospiraceae bacterium]|nr:SHOCT domain-containing protein [Lachnospiraceae bacterium]
MAPKKIKVKPGKTQSKMGFVVGILFVILGVFVVIPTFGLFGLIWTGVAGMIAFTHYKNGFSNEGVATHEIIIEDGMEITEKDNAEEDIEAKLIKLNSLYDQRLITKEEYDEKRKELLDEF